MEEKWVVKIYQNERKKRLIKKICQKYDLVLKDNCFVGYFHTKPKRLLRKLTFYGLNHIVYQKEYERSSNYRQNFFAATKGPYRCRYCNKPLTKHELCVDHIIPVAKSQKRKSARFMLRIQGCQSVNDTKNLAPSCCSCNTRKSDKMGLWIIRGWLGKYKIYWGVLRIIQFVLLGLTIYGLYLLFVKYL